MRSLVVSKHIFVFYLWRKTSKEMYAYLNIYGEFTLLYILNSWIFNFSRHVMNKVNKPGEETRTSGIKFLKISSRILQLRSTIMILKTVRLISIRFNTCVPLLSATFLIQKCFPQKNNFLIKRESHLGSLWNVLHVKCPLSLLDLNINIYFWTHFNRTARYEM
jgi:hypothetical protein